MKFPFRLASFLALAIVLTVRPPARAADDPTPTDESWDAVYLGNDKVGYAHTVVQNVKEDGKELVHVRVETVMTMNRFGQVIELKAKNLSVETSDGKLLRMDNRMQPSGGEDEQRIRCEVVGDKMKVTLTTRGKETTNSIPWNGEVLGPHAEDRILKRDGLKPGQERSFSSFDPELGLQIFKTHLYGEDMEEVSLHDGTKRKLQRVRQQIEGVPALKNLKMFTWVDEEGDALKTHTDMLRMTTFRVSKEVALAKPTALPKDFGFSTLVKADKRIPRAYETSQVVFRVELKDDDAEEVFIQDERQSISKNDNGEVLLTIRAIDPAQPAPESAKVPGPEFLAANNFLQTDDAKVIAAAKEAIGDATDPWDKAQRIEKWVYKAITKKNFNLGLATAAQVAQDREGDCTEHAFLLSALARVAGVPSRVAMGLVYADSLGAFGYHMWSEVYINGHWVPLDGTLGLGHASPTHIKIMDSSLVGVDALATFLPVARVMERLKLEVVSWEHSSNNNK